MMKMTFGFLSNNDCRSYPLR